MARPFLTIVCIVVFTQMLLAQAPGLPLVESPTTSSGPRFFAEGDLLWAKPKFNGSMQPTQFDSTFIPQLNVGWNISEASAIVLGYRWLDTQVSEVFNAGVPDLESVVNRNLNLQTFDLIYRERMGGPDAPFGMDVDMGFRFAWAGLDDEINATTIAGPVLTHRTLDFLTGGTRIGIKPYWAFDPSGWRMTLYAQGHLAYLWGTFQAQSWTDHLPTVNAKDNSTLWNWDAEAGLSMFVPGLEGILQVSAGYRYEMWSIDRLGFMTGSDTGQLTNHGPFIKLQFSF